MREVIHTESHEVPVQMLATRRRRRPLAVIVTILLAVAWIAAALIAGGAPARAGTDHVVEIVDFAYAPADLTITVGDSVTWTNLDAVEHTATATDDAWDTGLLAQGESGSITFTAPGTYEYLCTPHPTMTGTITVLAAATAAPAASPTPAPSPAPGGALPDVAMAADSGSRTGLVLLGTALLGIALLSVAVQAVYGRGESGKG